MVRINSGSFTQGYTENLKGFGFDNEKPSFQRFVHAIFGYLNIKYLFMNL